MLIGLNVPYLGSGWSITPLWLSPSSGGGGGGGGPTLFDMAQSGDGNLYVYGHSIAAGQGASDTAHTWASLVASGVDLTLNERAVSGETAKSIYQDVTMGAHAGRWAVPTRGSLVAIENGANTEREFGDAGLLAYAHFIRGMCVTVRAASVLYQGGNFTFTGTWGSNVYTYAMSGNVKASNTAGDFYEVPFNGDHVALFAFVNGGEAPEVEFKVDGVVQRTVTYDTTTVVPGEGDYNTQVCERFAGLGAGAHTLRVTIVSSGFYYYADAIAIEDTNPTPVILVTENYSYSYTTGASAAPYNKSSDAVVDSYNAVMDSVAAEFTDHKVVVARTTGWNTGTDMSDEVHPDNSGHQKMATSILAYVTRTPPASVSLPFTDTFSRANGLMGNPWVDVLGGWRIVSNEATNGIGAGLPWAPGVTVSVSVVDTSTPNHTVEIATVNQFKNSASIVVRFQDILNFIAMDTEQDNTVIEVIAGVPQYRMTLISHPGDTLKVVAGEVVECFINGVSQGSFLPVLTTGTKVGLYGYDGNAQNLNAEVTSFTASATATQAVLFADNFQAADGDLSAPWYYRTDGFHGQRISGVLTDTNSAGGITFYDAPDDDLDVTVGMKFPASAGSYMDVQIAWKGQHVTDTFFPASTGYFLFATNLGNAGNSASVFYYDSGGGRTTLFAGGNFVVGTLYTVRILHVGTSLTIFIDGVLFYQGTVTDNPGQRTMCLLMNGPTGGAGTPSFDNFVVAVPALSAGFTDNFASADGALGSPWVVTPAGGITISGDQAVHTAATVNVSAAIDIGQTDFDMSCTIVTALPWTGLIFNFNGTDYGYFYNNPSYGWLIGQFLNGIYTTLGYTAATPASGDVLRLTRVGTTLTGYINGAALISATENGLTGTQVGLFANPVDAAYSRFAIA